MSHCNRSVFRNQFILISLFVMLISGCAQQYGHSKPITWRVNTYYDVCQHEMMSLEPACIMLGGEGFKYKGEFSACKESVENYTAAADEYYECKGKKLKGIFNNLIVGSRNVYNCYAEFLEVNEPEALSLKCPAVNVPESKNKDYSVKGLEHKYGIPNCVGGTYRDVHIPKDNFGLLMCKEDVKAFSGSVSELSMHGEKSAQKQYDLYMKNMREFLDENIKNVIDKFNCIAERRGNCNLNF
jgi:hypothetical protein